LASIDFSEPPLDVADFGGPSAADNLDGDLQIVFGMDSLAKIYRFFHLGKAALQSV
jgi:hypothetical protein